MTTLHSVAEPGRRGVPPRREFSSPPHARRSANLETWLSLHPSLQQFCELHPSLPRCSSLAVTKPAPARPALEQAVPRLVRTRRSARKVPARSRHVPMACAEPRANQTELKSRFRTQATAAMKCATELETLGLRLMRTTFPPTSTTAKLASAMEKLRRSQTLPLVPHAMTTGFAARLENVSTAS